MRTSTAFPGFDSPAVGFEQPFELLEACHARVQRSLSLLQKLLNHIEQLGHDAQSRSAAADVLRYFDVAAPLHHDDEEVNVFPLLQAEGDVHLRATVQTLQAQHQEMNALWALLRVPLQNWSQPSASDPVDATTRSSVARFCALYGEHIATEEGLVYPAARARLDAAGLESLGRQMQVRRQG